MMPSRFSRLALLFFAATLPAVASTTLTRTTSYQYNANGVLTKETVEPGNVALSASSSYVLDGFGNRVSTTVSATASGEAAVTDRASSAGYDSSGRFATSTSNPLSQSSTATFHAGLGVETSRTDINGLTTSWSYDEFGRRSRETRPDGTITTWSYVLCNGGCAGNQLVSPNYYVETKQLAADGATQIGPTSRSYFDLYGNAIRGEVQGFDGRWIVTLTQYDAYGRVKAVSRPYYSGDTVYWTQYQYDLLDRVSKETPPDGYATTSSYSGLITTVTNANSQVTSKTRNSRGELIKVTDANGKVLTLQYDPFGNLVQTTDPTNNHIVNTYDLLGRKLSTQDPDMGAWTYAYDGFGELIKQTDAKGSITIYRYDAIGRLLERREPDLVATWNFDTCNKGVGKLCQASSDNGYQQSYRYDSYGRAAGSDAVLDSNYSVSNSYDSAGRLISQTYPSGLVLSYSYNGLGYLTDVKDELGQSYWKALQVDAAGHLLQTRYGNTVVTDTAYDAKSGRVTRIQGNAGAVLDLSFQYDKIGNLLSRVDSKLTVSESFTYDKLNRLSTAQLVNLPSIPTVSYTYDDLGNITSRSDVGTYTYAPAHPHAVAQVTGTLSGSYGYDSNGNQISGGGRATTFASYNLPIRIERNGKVDQFVYGPDHQRIKQATADGGTIYYLNPDNAGGLLFEKEIKADGTVENKHYLNAGGQSFAQLTQRSDGSKELRYWHKDQLGSLAAVTDEAGNIVERQSYEPFGKRRELTGEVDTDNSVTGQSSDRGYTGHEHLDDVGLIHMNGRVYDPQLGRFLSADPTVPNPEWLQDFNRYSYQTNNPFAGTDPTGFTGEALEGYAGAAGDGSAGAAPNAGASATQAIADAKRERSIADGIKALQRDNQELLRDGHKGAIELSDSILKRMADDRTILVRLSRQQSQAEDRLQDLERLCGSSCRSAEVLKDLSWKLGWGERGIGYAYATEYGGMFAGRGGSLPAKDLARGLNKVLDKIATKGLTKEDFPEIATEISQKQMRHIAGRPELAARGGGGYLDSIADAQAVLDAYHSGTARILGKTSHGFPVVKVKSVTGTNVNFGTGISNQPTNVFFIKGTAKPSVVPTNPNWKPS